MKSTLRLTAAAILAVFFSGCSATGSAKLDVTTEVPPNPGLFVKKVDGLSDAFIRGADLSTVIAQEASGVVYKDKDGNPKDIFLTLKENGVNYIRVRVWVYPFDENGNSFGGGSNDLQTAIKIGQRATAAGMPLLVDFHYSDFWADPSKQKAPRAWAEMDINTKSRALYKYTKESLKKIIKSGVCVKMVQIGNETTGAMCGENNWLKIAQLMNAGSKAVREISKDIKVVLHFANPEKNGSYMQYAKILANNEVDYDVFASSWYPFWHGTTENLVKVLKEVSDFSGKEVMIAEFSYAYTYEDGDDSGNTISESAVIDRPYPISVQGQADCIRETIAAAASIGPKCLGVFYWEPAWIPVPGSNRQERMQLWEKYGSGWASSFASVYDPDDAGKFYGGSAWDNQALFDFNGVPLASLSVFGLAGVGAKTEVKPDTVKESFVRVRLGDAVTLPETVKVLNNDGSAEVLPVQWNAFSEEGIPVEQLSQNGVALYRVYGKAGGIRALAKVEAVEVNYVENYSFEDKDLSMWKITNIEDSCKELFVQDKINDAFSGSRALHWWSDKNLKFTVEQKITGLKPGVYKLSMRIHGGDAKNQKMELFAVSGSKEYAEQTDVDGWRNFRNPVIKGIKVTDGIITVGARVACDAKGWGCLDDFILTPEKN